MAAEGTVIKVKICGLTNREDALAAARAGADLLGFIFYEPSPRYVRPELVRAIISEQLAMNQEPPLFIGVFVNASLDMVRHVLDFCRLDAAQLHGDESPEFVSQLPGRAFKALRPQSLEEAQALIDQYLPPFHPSNPPPFHPSILPSFLLDAYHPALYGGTGQVADWSMAATIARRYPVMLAGSLTPANVVEAIRAVRPWGVDVSSGVEKEKGKKDHDKVIEFIKIVRNVKRET